MLPETYKIWNLNMHEDECLKRFHKKFKHFKIF